MSYGTRKAVEIADAELRTVPLTKKGRRNGNRVNAIRMRLEKAFLAEGFSPVECARNASRWQYQANAGIR